MTKPFEKTKKQNLIKTTTLTTAMLAAAISLPNMASAAVRTTTAAGAWVATGTNLDAGGPINADGSDVLSYDNAQDGTINAAAKLKAIYVNQNLNANNITVATGNTFIVGSIGLSSTRAAGHALGSIIMKHDAGTVLQLTGDASTEGGALVKANDYTGLTKIDLSNGGGNGGTIKFNLTNKEQVLKFTPNINVANASGDNLLFLAENNKVELKGDIATTDLAKATIGKNAQLILGRNYATAITAVKLGEEGATLTVYNADQAKAKGLTFVDNTKLQIYGVAFNAGADVNLTTKKVIIEMRGAGSAALDTTTGGQHTTTTLTNGATFTQAIQNGENAAIHVYGSGNKLAAATKIGSVVMKDNSQLEFAEVMANVGKITADSTNTEVILSKANDLELKEIGEISKMLGKLTANINDDNKKLTTSEAIFVQNLVQQNAGNNLAIEIKHGGRIDNITTANAGKLTSIKALNNTNTITLVNIGEAGKNIPLVQAGDAGDAGKIKFDNVKDGNKLYVEEIKVGNVANSSISFADGFKLAAHTNFRPALVAASAANGAFIMEGNFDWSNGAIATDNALNLQVKKDQAILNLSGTKTSAAGTGATTVATAVTINKLALVGADTKNLGIFLPDTAENGTHSVTAITAEASGADVTLGVDFGTSKKNKFALGSFVGNGSTELGTLAINTEAELADRATLIFAGEKNQIGAIEMANEKQFVHYQFDTIVNTNTTYAGVLVKSLPHDENTNIIVNANVANSTAKLTAVTEKEGDKVKFEGSFNKLQFIGGQIDTGKMVLKDLDITFKQMESANANNGTVALSNSNLTVTTASAGGAIGSLLIEDGISTIAGAGLKGVTVKIADTEKAILSFKEDLDVTITGAGNGANGGILSFSNADALTVKNTKISAGDANSMKEIQFTGNNISFADDKLAVEGGANVGLVFNSDKDITIATGKGFNFTGNVKNLQAKKAVLEINDAASNQITKDIISDNAVDLVYGKDVTTLTINTKTIKGANLLVKESGINSLKLTRVNTVIDKIGAEGAAWKKLEVEENATVTYGLVANEVVVTADKKLTVGGLVKAESGITLNDGDAGLVVLKDAKLDAEVKTSIANFGTVAFEGAAQIRKNLGTASKPLATVNLGDTGEHKLSANAYAQNMTIGSNGLVMGRDGNLVTANLSLDRARINLGENKLEIQATKANIKGTTNINVALVKTDTGTTKVGLMKMASNNATKLEKDAKIIITPSYAKELSAANGMSNSFTVLDLSGVNSELLTKDNVVADSNAGDLFSKWDVVIAGNKVTLVQSDNAKELVSDLNEKLSSQGFSEQDGTVVNMSSLLSTQEARKFIIDQLGDQPRDVAESKVMELSQNLADVPQSADRTTQVATSSLDVAANVVDNALSNIAAPTADVASGDETGRAVGAWFAANYITGEQKERNKIPGYKHNGMAVTLGSDVAANDSLVVGIAATAAKNSVKPEGAKKSDKTTINSMLFSAYGMQQITDELYAQVVATVASNNVKSKSSRVSGATSYDTITSKYKNSAVSGNVTMGYKINTEQKMVVVPMVGVRFGMVNGFDYTEAGSSIGMNMSMKAQAKRAVEGMAGVRLMVNQFDAGSVMIKPELHAMAFKNFARKAAKSQLMLGRVDLSTKAPKAVDMSYLAGASVNLQSAGYEAGLGYDAMVASERIAHQGTLKLRVNF